MKRRLLSVLLMMVLAIPISFGLSGISAFADDEDYIEIRTIEDLYNVRNDLSANYKLMNDIDMSETSDPDSIYNYYGMGWNPIGSDGNYSGDYATSEKFTGCIDGNGHTIYNLCINATKRPKGDSGDTSAGLFMYNMGVIKNLHIRNSTVYATNCAGPFASFNYGTISRCSFDGTCEANSFAGGICGYCFQNAKIKECYNRGTIKANTSSGYSGGIYAMFGTSGLEVIEDCYSIGTVSGRYPSKLGPLYSNSKCVVNSYYVDINEGVISGGYYDANGKSTSLTSSQLLKKQYYTNNDFENIWTIETATDYKYPQLRNNMMDTAKHVDIIEWKSEPTKIDYYTDEDIDPTGGIFTAYYIDDTHEDIEVTKDMLSGYDMTQLGVQTVTVTFREGILTYDILTSTRPEVKSLTLETMPDKTEFARGTAFDFTGASARVEYVNGNYDIIPITAEETTGGNINQSGTYTITFEKFGKTVTFDVKVVPVKPIGIKIASLPDKTTYIEGQSLNLTGLVVKLEYNSGKTETITDYTVGEYENTVGTKEITVTYEDFTTSFSVEFVEKNLTNIMVTTQPSKAKYVMGEAFDRTGMVVKAVYDNGISEEITDYTVSDIPEATGWQTLTVSYEGKTTTIRVMVEAKELVSIFVSQMPTKTTYIEGETFDPEGMVVMANYNDVLNEEITDYTLSGTTLNKVGENKITVLYEGMTASFNVTVVEKKLVKITVTPPTKTEYIAGEEFDETGMVVKAVYDNGKSENVTGYTVNGFDESEEDNVVIIEYAGKTSAFIVTIHTPASEWIVTKTPTCTENGAQELHCANCGKVLKTEEIDAAGHEWGDWQIVDAPNCTDKGSQKRICNICSAEEFKDVDPTGHTWVEEYVVDVEPTCTLEGSESWHCSECGVSNPESIRVIDKLPHNLGEWTTTKEATCGVAGVRQRACADCDYLETEEIPATGNHTFGDWTTVKEPKCTETGIKDRECSVCHLVESEDIPATGKHQYGEWTTTKEPTYTETGLKERVCAVCGNIESEVLPVKEKPATALRVKNLWASQHSVGKVLFKWTKKDGVTVTGWNLKYRTRKIGAGGSWSGWTTKSYSASTYEAWINVSVDYVIEIHAQAKGDTTWSTGIITTPAGGKYQAMKTTYVKNVDTNKRLTGSTITLKKGQSIRVRPDYEYPIKDYNKRPRLYPNQMLYDVSDKSIISIIKPDGSTYTGGMIDGIATIKGTKAGSTQIVFRAPNGRTQVFTVKVTG